MDSTPLRVPFSALDPNTTNTPNASILAGYSSSPVKKAMMQSPLQRLEKQMMQTRTPPETERKRGLGKGVESVSELSPTTSRVDVLVPAEEEEEGRVVKKARLSYSRSPSPASSVFSSPPTTTVQQNSQENDENDVSQATTALTIPDVPAPATLPTTTTTRPRLTREQARQKAEILRLRLGLADYKVKTGQTDVSLDQLERRHMLRQWGQQSQPQLQRSVYQQQQQHSRQYSREMPAPLPSSMRQQQRSSSGVVGSSWREELWEVMRRREMQREKRREEGDREGEETEEEGEGELPRSPKEEGDSRGVEAVSGLLSLARG